MIKKVIAMICGTGEISDYESAVYRVFTSTDGKRILEEFIAQDYTNPLKTMDAETLAFAEGQRALIRGFMDIVAFCADKAKKHQEKLANGQAKPTTTR